MNHYQDKLEGIQRDKLHRAEKESAVIVQEINPEATNTKEIIKKQSLAARISCSLGLSSKRRPKDKQIAP